MVTALDPVVAVELTVTGKESVVPPLPTVTVPTVIPVPANTGFAPARKPDPVIVTVVVVLRFWDVGDIEANTGAGFTVKRPAFVVFPPSDRVTITSRGPVVALAEIVTFAVTCVVLL